MGDDDIIAALETELAAGTIVTGDMPDDEVCADYDEHDEFDARAVFTPDGDGFTIGVPERSRLIVARRATERIVALESGDDVPVAFTDDPLAQLAYETSTGVGVTNARIDDLRIVVEGARSGHVSSTAQLWCWARALNGLRHDLISQYPQLTSETATVTSGVALDEILDAFGDLVALGIFQVAATQLAD